MRCSAAPSRPPLITISRRPTVGRSATSTAARLTAARSTCGEGPDGRIIVDTIEAVTGSIAFVIDRPPPGRACDQHDPSLVRRDPGGDRPVLVLTRDPLAERIGSVVVAALTRTKRDLVSELELTGARDGVPSDCVVNFDNLDTIPRSVFRRRIATLSSPRIAQACRALRDAVGYKPCRKSRSRRKCRLRSSAAPQPSFRSRPPYGNVAKRAIMGTRGLRPLGSRCTAPLVRSARRGTHKQSRARGARLPREAGAVESPTICPST